MAGRTAALWLAYALIGWLFAWAALAAAPATATNSAPGLTTGNQSAPIPATLPAPVPTPAPTSATTAAAEALGAMHDKILKNDCRGHFDYGAKLLRLSASALKGVCVLLPANAFIVAQGPLTKRSFIAALGYPIQKIAGVRGEDSIALNNERIDRTIKKYGLIPLGINGAIPLPIVAKPIVIQTDYDMGMFDAYPGKIFGTPDLFIIIGTKSLIQGDGRVIIVPVLRQLGTPEYHHVLYPDDPNLFPS